MLARCCRVALALLLGVGLDSSATTAAERPNILLVVADDLGWADVGFHSNRQLTPNLDELARNGVQLDQHYVAPVCSPTRCALMSGRYWSRFGVTNPQAERAMPFDTVTLPVALKSMGYDTAMAGKWHLGSLPEWGPRKFGFDHSYGSLGGGVGPYTHRYKDGPYARTWQRDDVLIDEEGHAVDLIAADAIRWIEGRGDRPFFLYVPFTAVHIPMDEPQQWLDKYPDIKNPNERLFAAATTHMDDALGRILAAIEKAGKRDDTLVIFTSDNGGIPTAQNDDERYAGKYLHGPVGGRNEPLRGTKGQLYEGGIRVSALANWPAKIKPGKVTAPIHAADWMPTLCGLVGYQPLGALRWDGRDVWPQLTGQPAQSRTLYWVGVGARSSAIRHGDMKLIVYHEPKAKKPQDDELFDLANDPFEKSNLAAKLPERVAELKALLKKEASRDRDRVVPHEGPPATGKSES